MPRSEICSKTARNRAQSQPEGLDCLVPKFPGQYNAMDSELRLISNIVEHARIASPNQLGPRSPQKDREALRATYGEVLNEPIPGRHLDLLQRFEDDDHVDGMSFQNRH